MLTDNELLNIEGGAVSWTTIGVVLGGIVTLLVGVFDGYFRPLKCN